jgi:hypothetical protein
MQFTRFLHNDAVTVGEMAERCARTAEQARARCAGDSSSELVFAEEGP